MKKHDKSAKKNTKKPKSAPRSGQKARRTSKRGNIPAVRILIRTRKLGGGNQCVVQELSAPLDKNEVARFEIEMCVRQTEVLELIPIRRDVSDADSVVNDAIRLANLPMVS